MAFIPPPQLNEPPASNSDQLTTAGPLPVPGFISNAGDTLGKEIDKAHGWVSANVGGPLSAAVQSLPTAPVTPTNQVAFSQPQAGPNVIDPLAIAAAEQGKGYTPPPTTVSPITPNGPTPTFQQAGAPAAPSFDTRPGAYPIQPAYPPTNPQGLTHDQMVQAGNGSQPTTVDGPYGPYYNDGTAHFPGDEGHGVYGPTAPKAPASGTGTGTGTGGTAGTGALDPFHQYTGGDILQMFNDAQAAGGDPAIIAWFKDFQTKDPAGAARFQPVFNAFMSKTGASGAYSEIANSPAEAAALLGMPLAQFNSMPWDIIAGPKYADLHDLARKAYNLDALQNELINRQTDHLYAAENFKNYVLGKDEYMKKVDTMLNEFDTALTGMDTSNPITRARMQNYRNYLVTIKGATQQKYINLINTATKQESADYERFNTMYKAAEANATALERQMDASANTSWQANVSLLTKSVQNMYDTIAKVGTASMDAYKLKVDAINAAAKLANDNITALAKLNASNAKVSGSGTNTSTVTNPDKSQTVTSTNFATGLVTVKTVDPTGKVTNSTTSYINGVTPADHGPKTVTTTDGENITKTTTIVTNGVTTTRQQVTSATTGKLVSDTTSTFDPSKPGDVAETPVERFKPIVGTKFTAAVYTTAPTKATATTTATLGVLGHLSPADIVALAAKDYNDPGLYLNQYLDAAKTFIVQEAATSGTFAAGHDLLATLSGTGLDGLSPEDAATAKQYYEADVIDNVSVGLLTYLGTTAVKAQLPKMYADLQSGQTSAGGFSGFFGGKVPLTEKAFTDKYSGSVAIPTLHTIYEAYKEFGSDELATAVQQKPDEAAGVIAANIKQYLNKEIPAYYG